LVEKFSEILRLVARDVLTTDMAIFDTSEHHGHQESSIDLHAGAKFLEYLELYIPELYGTFLLENLVIKKEKRKEGDIRVVLIVDQLDGTTTAKRAKAMSEIKYIPQSAISVAICNGETLNDLQAGIVYDFSSGMIFSAIRTEAGEFKSYVEERRMHPDQFTNVKGDTKNRILVSEYSNENIEEMAKIKKALYDRSFRIYGGYRSSSVDIISIILNQNDAIIDPRNIFGEKGGAVLQVYDIAGIVPVVLGLGFVVSDVFGGSYKLYRYSDPISLIVSKPGIYNEIQEIIRPIAIQFSR